MTAYQTNWSNLTGATFSSNGNYRDVWMIDQPEIPFQSVLKLLRRNKGLNIKAIRTVLRDALIMSIFSSSEKIVDIYGHCGTTIWAEALPYEVEDAIVPDGYIKQEELHDEIEVQPQNNFTATEKLQMALEMAESIALLHGYADGVIVHDDIQLCQWLRNEQGRLKLGDFNRAEVMNWNDEKQEYCKYINGRGYGNVSSRRGSGATEAKEWLISLELVVG